MSKNPTPVNVGGRILALMLRKIITIAVIVNKTEII